MRSAEQWFVVCTKPRAEIFAAQHIKATGMEVFLPLLVKPTHQEALFPSYLFAHFDVRDRSWARLYGTQGVVKLLGSCDKYEPSPIPDWVIEELRERCDDRGAICMNEVVNDDRVVKPGDAVKVLDGPFANFEGVCQMTSKNRVMVLMTLFGQVREIKMERSSVCLA